MFRLMLDLSCEKGNIFKPIAAYALSVMCKKLGSSAQKSCLENLIAWLRQQRISTAVVKGA